jgi:RimJ/RimL family protein N-acetyltransferase
LRALDRRHLDATRRWANDPALARVLDRAWPISELEHDAWFNSLQGRRDCAYFAIERRDPAAHVGNIWVWDIDWRHRKAEIRIVLAPGVEGRGLGSESIDLLTAYAFDRLNLHRVFAYVLATNARARRAFEKAGFHVEGTLREDRWTGDRYSDVYVLGRLA